MFINGNIPEQITYVLSDKRTSNIKSDKFEIKETFHQAFPANSINSSKLLDAQQYALNYNKYTLNSTSATTSKTLDNKPISNIKLLEHGSMYYYNVLIDDMRVELNEEMLIET